MYDVTPVTTRHETACGPACLKMLLGYYGIDVPLDTLIEECGVRVNGSAAKDLLRVGRAHGLAGFASYSETPEDVLRQDRPAIIWWRYTHFIVFCGTDEAGEPWICNPSQGRYRIDAGTFRTLCSGLEAGTCVALCNGRPEDVYPTATGNHAAGEVFEAGRQTYRALRAIARGERLVIGANCEAVNLMDLINQKTEEE